jgi:hypothetical protein
MARVSEQRMFDPDAPLDLDQLRTRLRAMSDAALKHWGAAAAYMCTSKANCGHPPRQVFVIQLEEARAECRRRHPKFRTPADTGTCRDSTTGILKS